MERYEEIVTQIKEYNRLLQNKELTESEKKMLEIKIGDLVDEAHRMTFKISMMEEYNYI